MNSEARLDSVVFQLTPTRTRFVRFVSSPEVLERVSTIESEIVQIEEALAIQSNGNHGQKSVEECWAKPTKLMTGNRSGFAGTAEGAIVLYKPETCLFELSTSLPIQHGNSRSNIKEPHFSG